MASEKRGLAGYLKLFFSGFIMGSADVVPGVSGGTMAFILGIYGELIESIAKFTSFDAIKTMLCFRLKKAFATLPWQFVLVLALGIVTAIVTTASGIKWMLENRPQEIWAFFFGLVLASIFTVLGRVKKWSPDRWIAMFAGAAGAWILVGLPFSSNPPDSWWYLMLCGAIAICAMILPGISGSFILVLMGKYDTVLGAVDGAKGAVLSGNWQALGSHVLVLLLFIAGVVLGIATFIRVLGWLFKKHPDLTVAVLIGFMAGSLRKVWPWKGLDGIENILPETWDWQTWGVVGLSVCGLLLVLGIEKLASGKETGEKKQK